MSEPPAKIGPYQILDRLGAGGMGEVFLAYDERLDRKVAIKRIHPGKSATAERRERFRREARVAAKLNHPAIVQVYDVLAEGDVDSIVMEYVEGTNLRRLVNDGPLSVAETVVIARDIAEGLAEAHRLGIVHRDLKSENVMVTPTGRAKIMDFGIAKRLLKEKTEESLTAMGHVIGTYRVMSPEQARGGEVDHRSDLFSLGVLLYESLTGRSPFEAENELATLNRIMLHRQTPACELNPAVPEELSLIVDHLMEKDPLLRPRSAGEVRRDLSLLTSASSPVGTATVADPLAKRFASRHAVEPASRDGAARRSPGSASSGRSFTLTLTHRSVTWASLLLVLLLGAAGAWLALRPAAEPLYVAVLAPDTSSAERAPEASLLASAVQSALIRGLISLEGVSPKSPEELRGISGSPMTVARAAAADEIVSSRLDCRPQACRVSLHRTRGTDGSLLWSESFDVPTDDLFLVSRAVENQLRRGYSGFKLRRGSSEIAVRDRDLREFLRLRQRFDSRQAESVEPFLQELAVIRGGSPRFLDAYLLAAAMLRDRYNRSRNPQDLARSFDLIHQAQDLAPGDPQPLLSLFTTALDAGQFATAEKALNDIERLLPGDAQVVERRAQLLDARGHPREALSLLRTAVASQPSWGRLYRLALKEYSLGELANARLHLRQLLDRSPGNRYGLSMLAQIELANGDPARAAALYQQLVRRSPQLNEISNLGLAYFLLGRYSEAADAFHRIVLQEPRNPFYTLNLADSFVLLGRDAEAAALYRKVLTLVGTGPSADPQLLTVKGQALAHLGRGPEAVAAVQEALRIAPANAQVAYEAALVFALLGERNSAVANAQRALQLGCEPRWFDFPWFAPLRRDPNFQAALRQHRTTKR
jgi:serine/threonine-protein kinase